MPVLRGAAVQQLRDAGVIQRGEDLALGEEAAVDLDAVQPAPDQLDRDAAPELPVVALGQVDHAHPAAAEPRQHPVRPDPFDRRLGRRQQVRRRAGLEDAVRTGVSREQRQDLGSKRVIAGSALHDERRSLLRRLHERVVEQRLDLSAALGIHALAHPSPLTPGARAGAGARARGIRNLNSNLNSKFPI